MIRSVYNCFVVITSCAFLRTASAQEFYWPVGEPLKGRVVNAVTGEPLSGARISFGEQEVLSGAGGEFLTQRGLSEGAVAIRGVDSLNGFAPVGGLGVLIVEPDLEAQGALEIRLRVGATVSIDLTVPSGCEETDFIIKASAPDKFSPSLKTGNRAKLIRRGDEWIARLMPSYTHDEACSTATELTVFSRDRLWCGSTTIRWGRGTKRAALSLGKCSGLRGTIVDDSGSLVPRARLALAPSAPGMVNGTRVIKWWSATSGHYFMEALRPGTYDLFVVSPQLELGHTSIDIHDRVLTKDIEVRAADEVGSILGILRSPANAVRLALSSPTNPVLRRERRVKRVRDGPLDFEFRDLPSGRYVVEVEWPSRLCWAPCRREVEVKGGTTCRLTFHQETLARSTSFTVNNARLSGGPNPFYWCVQVETKWVEGLACSGDVVTVRVPEASDPIVTIYSPEFRLHRGQLRLTKQEPAMIQLAPGWGAIVKVLDADRVVVSGAQVFADNKLIGRTDREGLLFVNLDRRPDVIAVAGYEVRSVTPGRGRGSGQDGTIDVLVERTK